MYVPPPNSVARFIANVSTFKDINLPIFALLYVGWKIYKKTKIVRFFLIAGLEIQSAHMKRQIPLSQLDFVTVSHPLIFVPFCRQTTRTFQGIPSLEETEETDILEKPTGRQKIRQFL